MTTYNEYVHYLNSEESYVNFTNDITKAIYIIGDQMIDGEFYCGLRCADHNILKHDSIEWREILEYGILIVPETESYISSETHEELESLGFTRLPLEKNHVMGF